MDRELCSPTTSLRQHKGHQQKTIEQLTRLQKVTDELGQHMPTDESIVMPIGLNKKWVFERKQNHISREHLNRAECPPKLSKCLHRIQAKQNKVNVKVRYRKVDPHDFFILSS